MEPIANGQWIHGVQPDSRFTHETGVYGTLGCGHYTIVAECGGHGCNWENLHESQQYNARLIAAAPDAYAALVDLIEQVAAYEFLHGANTSPICPDQAQAVISQLRVGSGCTLAEALSAYGF